MDKWRFWTLFAIRAIFVLGPIIMLAGFLFIASLWLIDGALHGQASTGYIQIDNDIHIKNIPLR